MAQAIQPNTGRTHPRPTAPLLSIAFPTFNRASMLAVAVESVCSQITATMGDRIELFVIDNASTDATAVTVAGLQANWPQLAYHRNDRNIGLERNLARCCERARGEYVWMFADDDLCLPGALEQVLRLAERGRHDFLFLNRDLRDEALVERHLPRLFYLHDDMEFADFRDLVAAYGMLSVTFVTSAVMRRERLKAVDWSPYLALELAYSPIGVWLESFAGRPALAVRSTLIGQRHFHPMAWHAGVDFDKMYVRDFPRLFHLLAGRAIIEFEYVEHIREIWDHRSVLLWPEIISNALLQQFAADIPISDEEWTLNLEMFGHFRTKLGSEHRNKLIEIHQEATAPRDQGSRTLRRGGLYFTVPRSLGRIYLDNQTVRQLKHKYPFAKSRLGLWLKMRRV